MVLRVVLVRHLSARGRSFSMGLPAFCRGRQAAEASLVCDVGQGQFSSVAVYGNVRVSKGVISYLLRAGDGVSILMLGPMLRLLDSNFLAWHADSPGP